MVDINNVLSAIPGVEPQAAAPSNLFTASTGVVLRAKAVSPLLIIDAQKKLREPRPPKVHNPDKGYDEENPADPDYIAAVAEYRQTIGEVSNAIWLTMGVDVVTVPNGMQDAESTEWSEMLEDVADITVPERGPRRRYCWLKYVVLTSMEDVQGLIGQISRMSGIVMEGDVQLAAGDFRSVSPRDTADGVSAA